MAEVRNCPSCGELFNYIGLKDVCNKCAMSEDELYETVYRFLRKRENRAATVERIEEVTGVSKDLLYKWVRKGRLQKALFPNLGYPCDNCGHITNAGKLCTKCQDEFKSELNSFDAEKELRDSIAKRERGVYHGIRDKD